MVHKRKSSAFNRDAFAPHAEMERVKNDVFLKQHKRQSFLFGIIIGFLLNTAVAVLLVSVQSEIEYKNSQAGIDDAIKIKIAEISTKLESMETPIYIPKPGEEAKEMND